MTEAIVTLDDQFTPLQHLLQARLHPLLALLVPPLRADVMRALEAEGKLLWRPDYPTERPAGVWGLLTLLVAQHLSPDIDQHQAASVAIAVECYICALDLLDDVEDSDRTPVVEELGVARVLSVATTLLFLAQRASLEATNQPQQAVRLIAAFSEASLTATAGQHRDILTAQRPVASLSAQECMEILAAKSGSLMSLACRLGALCAGVSEQACVAWARLGELMGLAHQLDNDAHDVYDILAADVLTRREVDAQGRAAKKLPVVLATQIYAKQRKLRSHADGDQEEDQRIWQLALQEAIVNTSCKAVLYRERARAHLEQLDARHPLSPALRFLLGG